MKSLLFKVEYESWSAQLQLPATATLEALASAILDAVGFEMDHCFGFYNNLKNPYRSDEEYSLFVDIGESDNPRAKGVKTTPISEAFAPEKVMIFVFDYGDDWWFRLTCTAEQEGRSFRKPKILSTIGTPPVQYPHFDE